MQRREVEDIQKTMRFKNAVMIEFAVVNTKVAFPVRKKFINLIEKLQVIDSTLIITESLDDALWRLAEELPSRRTFDKVFHLRKTEATRSVPKVVLYCTIESAVKLGDTKCNEQMFAFLHTYKIFIDYGHIETKEKGNQGYLMEIHPKLTNKISLGYTLGLDMKDMTFEQDDKEKQQTGEEVLQELTEF
eukprot:15331826-Ditylum_brightwellii.AAC.1